MSAAPHVAPMSHRRKAAGALFGVGAVLTITGWPIAAWIYCSNIVSSHTSPGYPDGDHCRHGFRINRPWAPFLFLIAYGAAVLYPICRLAAWEFRALGAVK